MGPFKMMPMTITMRMTPLLIAGALASTNCFSPKINEGVTCGEGDSCPAGMQCDSVDQRCRFELLPQGKALVIIPDEFTFGNVVQGNPSSISTFSVFNSGLVPSTALQVTLVGDPQFRITSNECRGMELPELSSCSISGIFEPTGLGLVTSDLRVSDADNTGVSNLSGTGLEPGDLLIEPPNLSFGIQAVGMDTTEVFTLRNSGSTSAQGVTITTAAMSTNDSFRIVDDNCSGQVLPSLQTCTFAATFSPKRAGTTNATIEANRLVGLGTSTTVDGLGTARIAISSPPNQSGEVGMVSSNPDGFDDCVPPCAETVFEVAPVTLIARGRNSAAFNKWMTPDCATRLCDVPMDVPVTQAVVQWKVCVKGEFLRCEDVDTLVKCGMQLTSEETEECAPGVCDPVAGVCTDCVPGETVCVSDGGNGFLTCGPDGFVPDGSTTAFCLEGGICVDGECTANGADG